MPACVKLEAPSAAFLPRQLRVSLGAMWVTHWLDGRAVCVFSRAGSQVLIAPAR